MTCPQLTLSRALARLGGLVDEADVPRVAELQRRLTQRRLRVLVVGEAKRGKSTLINALLGRPALPTGVVPVTAVATTVVNGADEGLTVEFDDGRSERHPLSRIVDFVTEAGNGGNARGVVAVTVRLDAPLLHGGVELVDTPGVGSVHEHNTTTAGHALGQMDTAVFVVSGDPPISASERAWLRTVHDQAVGVVCVLNKADRLDSHDLEQAVAFTSAIVVDELGEDTEVWPVSATRALAGYDEDGQWSRFRTKLAQTLHQHGARDLHRSVQARAQRLAVAVGEREQATVAALSLTEQQMQTRLAVFEGELAQVDEARFASAALVQAHIDRLRAETDAQAVALPQATAPAVLAAVQDRLQHEPGAERSVEEAALNVAAEHIERVVEGWRTHRAHELNRAVQQLVRDATAQVDQHVAAVRAVAAELFELDLELAQVPDELVPSVRFWYAFGTDPGQTQALAGAVRRRLPGRVGRRRTQRYVRQRTADLLAQQVGRARADLDHRLRETRRMLLKGLEQRFDEGAGRIADALRQGERLRRSGAAELVTARDASHHRRALATDLVADLAAYDLAQDGAG